MTDNRADQPMSCENCDRMAPATLLSDLSLNLIIGRFFFINSVTFRFAYHRLLSLSYFSSWKRTMTHTIAYQHLAQEERNLNCLSRFVFFIIL